MRASSSTRFVRALAAAAVFVGLAASARAEETKMIKIATLAPDGSSWMKLFREWGVGIEKRVPGLKVKFFAGGVSGDERDAVRKMRLGQINGAAVTAIGLGLIQPEVRVLELPFVITTYDELDHVRSALDAELRQKFNDKGYVLLAWGDVGPVHLFSNTPIKSRDDFAKMKFWAWTDDPLVRSLFQQIGLNGVPLGVPDVLPSLQTGLINACYGSPYATLALQWHSKVKYMTSMVVSQSVGAVVMTKAAWDGLGADAQKAVNEESKKLQEAILKQVRTDNVAALKKMQSGGLEVVPTPEAVVEEFRKNAKIVAQKLEGQVYTHEFRMRVENMANQFRASTRK